MNLVEEFIRPESLIMIPVLYVIGLFLRQTPFVPLWCHAWIKVAIGVTFCILYYGSHISSVVQGILVAGAAVLVKDMIHLPDVRKNGDDDEN